MSYHVLIPARKGSERIIGKNMVEVHGAPLIAWTVQQALLLGCPVTVSSDWPELLEFVERMGADTLIRPSDISDKFASTEEAIEHFKDNRPEVDHIILIQPTSPLLIARHVIAAIESLEASSDLIDSIFSGYNLEGFVWSHRGNGWKSDYNMYARPRSQELPLRRVENGAFYVFAWASKTRFGAKKGIYSMSVLESTQVDVDHDLHVCEIMLESQIRGGSRDEISQAT